MARDFGPVIDGLRARFPMSVFHVETNGTLWRPWVDRLDHVTVSPKEQGDVDPRMARAAHEFKFVVTTEEDVERILREWGSHRGKVALQPNANEPTATKVCTDACLRYGLRLSLQQHKVLGMR